MNDIIQYLSDLPVVTGMVALILMGCSCSNSPENNNSRDNKDQTSNLRNIQKPPSSFDDTIIIDRQAAVFYNPDSLQLDKIKLVNQKRVYETMTHDCFYMIQNARNVLKQHWPQIRIIEVSKVRYLLFLKKDKSKICIDLNKRNSICGLYLFDLLKNPQPVDMPNVDTYLGFYFGK